MCVVATFWRGSSLIFEDGVGFDAAKLEETAVDLIRLSFDVKQVLRFPDSTITSMLVRILSLPRAIPISTRTRLRSCVRPCRMRSTMNRRSLSALSARIANDHTWWPPGSRLLHCAGGSAAFCLPPLSSTILTGKLSRFSRFFSSSTTTGPTQTMSRSHFLSQTKLEVWG